MTLFFIWAAVWAIVGVAAGVTVWASMERLDNDR